MIVRSSLAGQSPDCAQEDAGGVGFAALMASSDVAAPLVALLGEGRREVRAQQGAEKKKGRWQVEGTHGSRIEDRAGSSFKLLVGTPHFDAGGMRGACSQRCAGRSGFNVPLALEGDAACVHWSIGFFSS